MTYRAMVEKVELREGGSNKNSKGNFLKRPMGYGYGNLSKRVRTVEPTGRVWCLGRELGNETPLSVFQAGT